ncbi:MAG: tetratricopeptide repeat protein [Methyloprofundus sp.]|nr:tetratricopeptide repeat protein [Methyloprofundus sp.]
MLQKSKLVIILFGMKQIMTLLLGAVLSLVPLLAIADSLQLAVQHVESEWARIHYRSATEQRAVEFQRLLHSVHTLKKKYPHQAELIIQQAIIVASKAEHVNPFSALAAIYEARDLLLQAIELNPNASDGAAFVVLGSLYYLVPGWPIAYGDDEKAQQLLSKALSINPNTIDANYFYADFLLAQGKQKQATLYFNRALAIPVRATQVFADTQLHTQAAQAVLAASQGLAINSKSGLSLAAK